LERGGGVEKLVFDLAKNFSNQIYQTSVLGFRSGSMIADLEENGICYFCMKKRRTIDPIFASKFWNVLRCTRPDIIHSHSFGPNFWSIILSKRFRTMKNVCTIHTLIRPVGLHKPFYNFINKEADKIVAVSEKVKDTYSRNFIGSNLALEVVYNGVSRKTHRLAKEQVRLLKESLGTNQQWKMVICVGRLEEPKGHRYLLEAAKRLSEKGIFFNYLIVGQGSLKTELERQVKKLGLGNQFIFTGYRSDVEKLIEIADIAVISSVREGFSVALLELMAKGIPIVATDVGGNREALLDGSSAIIVPPGNAIELSRGIERLANDDQLSSALGLEAKRVFEIKFTRSRMAEEYDRIYREVLNSTA
jgi:glycosyltransferase involved in cell wall biosynthesis